LTLHISFNSIASKNRNFIRENIKSYIANYFASISKNAFYFKAIFRCVNNKNLCILEAIQRGAGDLGREKNAVVALVEIGIKDLSMADEALFHLQNP